MTSSVELDQEVDEIDFRTLERNPLLTKLRQHKRACQLLPPLLEKESLKVRRKAGLLNRKVYWRSGQG